jgi:hypothetical protein
MSDTKKKANEDISAIFIKYFKDKRYGLQCLTKADVTYISFYICREGKNWNTQWLQIYALYSDDMATTVLRKCTPTPSERQGWEWTHTGWVSLAWA